MENVMHDIKIIEEDVENVEKKCENVDCTPKQNACLY